MNRIFQTLQAEIPGLTELDMDKAFSELSLDSFDLVTLRVSVEHALGPIDDRTWTEMRTPADILGLGKTKSAEIEAPAAGYERRLIVGMPQMALSGLSESWLFKEVGDVHWHLITDGLGKPSSELIDGNGDRLYATFTRVRMRHTAPLTAIRENSGLTIGGSISRYGGGIFIGDYVCDAGDSQIAVSVASSFAKRGIAGSNKDLMKGQPAIPQNSPIGVLSEKPAFIEEYRERRGSAFSTPIFECDYRINPYHDINGVGLLYFAAYPSIADTCETVYVAEGNSWAARSSTVFRDIFYFANSDADETLLYSVLARRDFGDEIETDALISRKGSRIPMAFVTTRKAING